VFVLHPLRIDSGPAMRGV